MYRSAVPDRPGSSTPLLSIDRQGVVGPARFFDKPVASGTVTSSSDLGVVFVLFRKCRRNSNNRLIAVTIVRASIQASKSFRTCAAVPWLYFRAFEIKLRYCNQENLTVVYASVLLT